MLATKDKTYVCDFSAGVATEGLFWEQAADVALRSATGVGSHAPPGAEWASRGSPPKCLKGGRVPELALGSGSMGRSGSPSMGSARAFFKRGVSLLHVGPCGYLHSEKMENVRSGVAA